MKKILILSATPFEIEPLLKALNNTAFPIGENIHATFYYRQLQVDILISGAGMVKTAFALGLLKGEVYSAAINAGVCGSFNNDLQIGEVVNVSEDVFSELGAEEGEEFLSLSEINLGEERADNHYPFTHQAVSGLKKVKGITVNTVHGNEESIEAVKKRLNPDVESMEGAAFFLACNNFKWPALQLRAVSNRVEKRNKENWSMGLAIANLNSCLIELLDNLS